MQRKKLLIADDDPYYRLMLGTLFRDYDTLFASNTEELIEKARKKESSLIITDNQMNDGYGDSGIYAIGEIRKFDPDVPIIFHSSDNSMKTSLKATLTGATHIVTKQSGIRELYRTAKYYLE